MADSYMNRVRFEQDLVGGFSNNEAQGSLPEVLPEVVRLNLGCGKDIREGYLNLDLFSSDSRVIKMDIRKLQFEDESADEILASDILEHFSHREITEILKEWVRVLKPGGKLIIRCPSLKLQAKAYLSGKWNADIASYMIFGGQTNPGDYHCVAFDEVSIKRHLENAGLILEEVIEHDFPQDRGFINLNMTVNSSKPVKELTESNAFPDFDFDDLEMLSDNLENELPSIQEGEVIIEPIDESETSEDDFDFDLDLFNEVSSYKGKDEFVNNSESTMPDKMKLNIVWEGSQFVYHSLALINREHCSNLINTGIANLTIVPYEQDQFDANMNQKFKNLLKNDIRYKEEVSEEVSNLPYIWIRHQWPPKDEPPRGSKWVIMQPWEYSSLRKDFVDLFNQADEIWTPSNFSRQSFVASGVNPDKVQVVPNGIDPQLFVPNGEKYQLNTKKNFKLLYVGGTIFRKGIDILLESYTKSFTSKDDVCLVIKDMGTESFYRGQNAKDFIAKLKAKPDAPEIIYINEDLTESEMASLYRSCNVFVSPYRGEGFSLPTLEAMACGLPVVVTKGGSTDDFTDESFAFYLDAEKRSLGTKLDNYEFANETFCFEPSKESLSDTLKFIHLNPGLLRSMGLLASLQARKYFTWKAATMKLLSRLDYLYGLNLAKDSTEILTDVADSELILCEAEYHFMHGNNSLSTVLFEEALEKNDLSDDLKVHAALRLALFAINANEEETAEVFLNIAEKSNSSHPDIQYLKTIFLASKGDEVSALETITDVLGSWSTQKYYSSYGVNLDDLLVLTADLLRGNGDLENANKVYTEALSYNPENYFACYGAGICFLESGIKNEAEKMFDWALKLNPEFELAEIALNSLENKNN